MTNPKQYTDQELLPCPFCGCALQTDQKIQQTKHPHIDCIGRNVSFCSERKDCIEQWNTRAAKQPNAATETALRSAEEWYTEINDYVDQNITLDGDLYNPEACEKIIRRIQADAIASVTPPARSDEEGWVNAELCEVDFSGDKTKLLFEVDPKTRWKAAHYVIAARPLKVAR